MKAKERLANYGFASLTDQDLFDLIKFKGSKEQFYASQNYLVYSEIIRRKTKQEIKLIKSSDDAFHHFSHIAHEGKEQFWTMFLNTRNKVLDVKFFTKGTITGTMVDCSSIIKEAILLNATGIILAHNHPSGNLNPSPEDKTITREVCDAAKLFRIRVFDHMIISEEGYYSFADNGLM